MNVSVVRTLLFAWFALLHAPRVFAECSQPAVDPAAVAKVVEQQLGAHSPGMQLVLEPVGEWPAGKTMTQRVITQGLKSRIAVSLVLDRCGQSVTSSVWFRVRAYRDAWVFSHNFRGGHALDASMLSKARIDLAGAQLSLDDLAEDPSGLWLVPDVRAGQPVLKRHLQPEPLVKRDEAVNVVITGNGLMLSARGIAMRPGQRGERIPVMLEWASSSLQAEVVGKGEVHVPQ